jgi:hypothetical protein
VCVLGGGAVSVARQIVFCSIVKVLQLQFVLVYGWVEVSKLWCFMSCKCLGCLEALRQLTLPSRVRNVTVGSLAVRLGASAVKLFPCQAERAKSALRSWQGWPRLARVKLANLPNAPLIIWYHLASIFSCMNDVCLFLWNGCFVPSFSSHNYLVLSLYFLFSNQYSDIVKWDRLSCGKRSLYPLLLPLIRPEKEARPVM